MQPSDKSRRPDRVLIEKHRRMQMKNLYSKLASLLPPQSTKGKLSVPIVLDLSCDHVENIKARMEKLKARREKLRVEAGISETGSLVLPSIVVNENGSTLEVNLMSGLNNRFKLHEILRILEEEGARVLSANYSTSRDRILYTICSQAFSSRIGIDTSRVQERLKRLIISPAMTRRQLDRAGREKDTC